MAMLPVKKKPNRPAAISALVLSLALSTNAAGLSPEVELDRYMLAVKKHLSENNHDKASEYVSRIKSLQVDLPFEFHYYQARLLQHRAEYKDAQASYEQYVNKAGNEGEFYQDALEQITYIEEKQSESKAKSADAQKAISERSNLLKKLNQAGSERTAYVDGLKKLYLTSSASKALTQHINAILNTHVYTGSRVQSDKNKDGIAYSINIGKGNEIVTIKRDQRTSPAKISTAKVAVYGANPFISYACDATRFRCWIKQPNDYDQWVETSYDESAAKELSVAFSRLVQTLQAGK